MKALLFALLITFSQFASANEITIAPGSSVVVSSGFSTVVRCEGAPVSKGQCFCEYGNEVGPVVMRYVVISANGAVSRSDIRDFSFSTFRSENLAQCKQEILKTNICL